TRGHAADDARGEVSLEERERHGVGAAGGLVEIVAHLAQELGRVARLPETLRNAEGGGHRRGDHRGRGTMTGDVAEQRDDAIGTLLVVAPPVTAAALGRTIDRRHLQLVLRQQITWRQKELLYRRG